MTGIISSSKEHLSLAKAELMALLETSVQEISPGIFLTPYYLDQEEINKTGFAKESFEIIDALPLEILSSKYLSSSDDEKKELIFNACTIFLEKNATDDYCIKQLLSDSSISFLTKDLQLAVAKKLSYKVNLSNPIITFYCLQTKDMFYMLRSVATQEDRAHKRRAHLQAVSKPIAIHPKIAKAMNLLAQSKTIVDPCCGAGGLLVEAALQGFIAKGSDIRADMVLASQENAKYFDVSIDVSTQDVFRIDETLSCIVTDLPYGRNSSLSLSKDSFYLKFFEHAQKLTSTLIVGLDAKINLEELLVGTKWVLVEEHEIYIHKSMTRKVYVLKK